MSIELEKKVVQLEEDLELAREVIRILWHWKVEGTELAVKNSHIVEEVVRYLH